MCIRKVIVTVACHGRTKTSPDRRIRGYAPMMSWRHCGVHVRLCSVAVAMCGVMPSIVIVLVEHGAKEFLKRGTIAVCRIGRKLDKGAEST